MSAKSQYTYTGQHKHTTFIRNSPTVKSYLKYHLSRIISYLSEPMHDLLYWDLINPFDPRHICAYPKPGPGFPT